MTRNTNELLHLDLPRVIAFTQGGQRFTMRFRRIVENDWKEYFEVVNSSAQRLDRYDMSPAGLALVEKTLETVDGYGSGFLELANWKDRVRSTHKIAAARLLTHVGRGETAEYTFDPDVEVVMLTSAWSADLESHRMMEHRELVHRLTPPPRKYQRKWNEVTSQSRGHDGSGVPITVYPNNAPVIAEMYDELIIAVEGYAAAGAPLSGAEQIRREMDVAHKIAAVSRLFAMPDEEEQATGAA
jgi:hypothetical protein